jgi:hypothetical protein
MKPDLRTKEGLLQVIYNSFDVINKEHLVFIRFITRQYGWQRIDWINEFTVTQGKLHNTEDDRDALRFIYKNIRDAMYFTVRYSNGCEMTCENNWDEETKQHKLTYLAQKVS